LERPGLKKASEYRVHADECRQLATKMASGEQRDLLLAMAKHWEDLARDRAALVRQHPELATPGEREDMANGVGDFEAPPA
jgi:hypothetical protein